MKYDITKKTPPVMPRFGKGLEVLKLFKGQVSENMLPTVVPTLFPPLAAHVSGAEFQHPNRSWKEPCGLMNHIIGVQGIGKGEMEMCAEAICKDFEDHDSQEYQKLVEWKREHSASQGKGKKEETATPPDLCFRWPSADVTNAGFINNAVACEANGGVVQYYKMPEIEMANLMCGSHQKLSPTIRNIYDCQRQGALRATIDGVTGKPTLRVCINFASTPIEARKFYKYELYNGTLARIVVSYKPRGERVGKIPRLGTYDEAFYSKLNVYLERLKACKGRFKIKQLNNLIDQLAMDMADLANLTDDDNIFDFAKRSMMNAWKAGCLLWILNDQVWTRAMGELVEWLVYHDLWSKMQVFGDLLLEGDSSMAKVGKRGPKNLLEGLPDNFSEAQLTALRQNVGKDPDGTKPQLSLWINRGHITYSAQTGLYSKTEQYLKSR